jgi:hypothetical protein
MDTRCQGVDYTTTIRSERLLLVVTVLCSTVVWESEDHLLFINRDDVLILLDTIYNIELNIKYSTRKRNNTN